MSIAPIRARASVDRDELDVELAVEVDVGDVRLLAGDAPMPPTRPATCRCHWVRRRRRVDARLAAPGARRPPAALPAAAAAHGLDDLLVAGAAAQVAGEPLLDLGARRVRAVARAAPAPTISWPGMQKPHCTAPVSRKACWSGWSRPPAASPSTVVTLAPSASTARTRHESTLTSSSSTVHAPHSPTRQHSFVPVSPRSSRSTSRSVWCGATVDRARAAVDRQLDRSPRRHARPSAARAARSPSRPPAGRARGASPAGTRGSPASTAGTGWRRRTAPRAAALCRRPAPPDRPGRRSRRRPGADAARGCRRRAESSRRRRPRRPA